MKNKILSLLLAGVVSAGIFPAYAAEAKQPDYSLWDNFLKYDLCITDYNSLTDEEKELCHFIFDTEQSADDNIVCERARRIIAGDDAGERITLEQLDNAYGLWDNYSYYKLYYGWQTYINCVPDVIRLNYDSYNYYYACPAEYWLDDERSSYVLFREKSSVDTPSRFEVYDENNKLINTIPTKFDCPVKDFRGTNEYMEEFGLIEKNGGWYYTKPDGTAVFAWSIYSAQDSSETITEPFVIESEINGCPVTAIEHDALAQAPFTEIVLPDTLEIIDRTAFAGCKYLEKINFPEKLKHIERFAFFGCESLTEIKLDCPDLNLAMAAFEECRGLTSAQVKVRSIGERAFGNCKSLENITLDEGIEIIGYKAFWGDISLSELNIPDSVKTIGQGALVNFTSVTIPPAVKVTGAYPHKTPQEFTSGLEPPPPARPLTDEPICVFDSDCVIYGYKGTEAERYANEWNLEFAELSAEKGDVNIDGEINIADMVTLSKYLLGRYTPTGAAYGDMNGDNSTDVYDMVILRKTLAGN